MTYYEYTVITTHEGAEAVADLLMELGASGTVIEDKADIDEAELQKSWDYAVDGLYAHLNGAVHVKAYFTDGSDSFKARLAQELEGLKKRCENAGSLQVQICAVDDQDWAENWKKYYKPIKLNKPVLS